MNINKPEAAFPQNSVPADQEGAPLLHCHYLKSVLYSLWKHANPAKYMLLPFSLKSQWSAFRKFFLSGLAEFQNFIHYTFITADESETFTQCNNISLFFHNKLKDINHCS